MNKEGNGSSPKGIVVLTYLATTIAYLLWLGGIMLAPYLKSRSSSWAGLLYALYSPVCHQVAERSLFYFGQPLAVCARCTGIYLGYGLGLVAYPCIRGWRRLALPSGRLFLIVSAPIVIDTAAVFIGFWETAPAVRLATGVLWGTILPFYFITGVADLFVSRRKNRLKRAPNSP